MSDIVLGPRAGDSGLLSRLTLRPRAILRRLFRAWRIHRQEVVIRNLDERTLADIGYRNRRLFEIDFDADGNIRDVKNDRQDDPIA